MTYAPWNDEAAMARNQSERLRCEIRQLRARLPHWRSPEERPLPAQSVIVLTRYNRIRVGSFWIRGPVTPVVPCFVSVENYVCHWSDILAWRPLAEVVDEIPEELKR